MGQYDAVIWVGGALVVGWFIIQNPSIFENILGGGDPPIENGDGGGDDTGGDGGDGGGDGGSGGGSADCKKACSNCWCKTYSEKCSGSCSKCKGGNRVMSKCGQGSDSGGGGGGGEFGSGDSGSSSSCKTWCSKGYCESYRAKCGSGCSKCGSGVNIGSSSCPAKVVSRNCGGDCKKTCWHGQSGSKTYDSCVSKSISGCSSASCSACQAARKKFCDNHGPCSSNLAYTYVAEEYPFGQVNFSNVYS